MFTDGEHKFTVREHKINRDMVLNKRIGRLKAEPPSKPSSIGILI